MREKSYKLTTYIAPFGLSTAEIFYKVRTFLLEILSPLTLGSRALKQRVVL